MKKIFFLLVIGALLFPMSGQTRIINEPMFFSQEEYH